MKLSGFFSKTNHYCAILTNGISLFIKVYLFNRIRTNQVIHELNSFLEKSNYSLKDEQLKRIRIYTIQSCLTNSWFCQLRGKNANSAETRKAIYIGAITPFLDDLVDSEKINSEQIFEQLRHLDKNSSEKIMIINYLYGKITNACIDKFNSIFTEALLAQDASLKQLQKEKLNHSELLEITLNKGASWTLLYRTILQNPIKNKENEAIITLGGLMQLTNDAFDVYKDFQNGQQSIFTNTNDLEPLNQQFVQLTHQMIAQFKQTDYSMKNKKQAIIQMMLIVSRGIICLEQLLQCQKKTGNQFKIETYTRKELICDMEKFGNIMKTVRVSYKYTL